MFWQMRLVSFPKKLWYKMNKQADIGEGEVFEAALTEDVVNDA